jgi:hypothetical protein
MKFSTTLASVLVLLAQLGSVRADDEDLPPRPIGVSIGIGGGLVGFADADTRNMLADVGGGWEARLTVGTNLPLALEVAYVGSVHDTGEGTMGDTMLLGNGVEGDLRVNLLPFWVFTPYALVGAGWTNYRLSDQDDADAVTASDNLISVPLGVGAAFRPYGTLFDVRAVYRVAFDDELISLPGERDASLSSWALQARLGWEF